MAIKERKTNSGLEIQKKTVCMWSANKNVGYIRIRSIITRRWRSHHGKVDDSDGGNHVCTLEENLNLILTNTKIQSGKATIKE